MEVKNIESLKPENKENAIVKNKRNSLIEFYRFLFALWVVWYHGFFAFSDASFSHGYIAVEFFFILSGFFIIKTINKYNNEPMFKGLFKMTWARLKSLGLPFIIGVLFSFWYMILDKEFSMLGYLWYIPFMFLSFAILFVLKRLIKNEKWFILILAFFVAVSYTLLYVPVLKGWGLFRGLGGVSLGALISYIPKINLKIKKFNFNWVITFLLFALVIYLAYIPKPNLISEYFLVLLIFPMLIYFTNTLQINCKVLNFLGSLSFGLYAYQCVIRIIEYYVPLQQYWLFSILIAIVLLDKLIEYVYKKLKVKFRKIKIK